MWSFLNTSTNSYLIHKIHAIGSIGIDKICSIVNSSKTASPWMPDFTHITPCYEDLPVSQD